LRENGR